MSVIALKVSTNSPIPLSVSDNTTVPMDIEQMRVKIIDRPSYTGPYEVTPMAFQSVVLGTRQKTLHNDVTIHEIPYYETTNQAGGYTAIIGG